MSKSVSKKVLVITYYWPPSGGSGVQRWVKFVKYLREFGWEPVVYTPSNPEQPALDHSLVKDIPDDVEVIRQPIREPYQFYKKFVGLKKDEKLGSALMKSGNERSLFHDISVWIRGNFFIPDARKFWIKPSIRFLTKYLNDHPVEALVSTGPPHSMHMIGMGVSGKTGIPWLADFRDPWTNIDFFEDLKLTTFARNKHHRLEKKVLDSAERILVISETMKKEFAELTDTPIKVITNGYDHEDFKPVAYSPSAKCTVSHVGMMTATRNPEILWEALSELRSTTTDFKNQFRLQLIGKVDERIKSDITSHDLGDIVQISDYIPHDQIVQVQQQSEALLLVINNSPNAPLLLTGKLFEYLGARRPIVCITPVHGDASRLLNETGTASVVLYDEKEALKKSLLKIYQSWKNGEDQYVESNAEAYSRRNLTKELSKELNQLIA